MKVIGLTGVAGSGKDTACGYALDWCDKEGYTAARVALADPLKVSAARALGAPSEWSDEECVDFCDDLKRPGMAVRVEMAHKDYIDGVSTPLISHELYAEVSGREFLQFYGTEAHRQVFGESFWTDVTRGIIQRKEREGVDIVFITDVRFPNEARFVLSEDDWHGEVWSIQRPDAAAIEAHSSEAGVGAELVDLLITNDGSLEDLRDAVRLTCDTLEDIE